MRPVDEFLRSVRTAFRPDDNATGYGWLWLLAVVVLLGLLLVLGRLRGRRQSRRLNAAALAKVMAARNLGGADQQLIVRMASRVGLEPALVATQPEAFERATAAELGAVTPSIARTTTTATTPTSPSAGVEELAAQVGRLRRSLGFHVLPDHLALVTTRQLASGQRVQIGAVEGMVTEVTEVVLVVEAAVGGAFPGAGTGQTVRMVFARGSEARYFAHCAVVEAQPARAPRRLTLRHDEEPERSQLRNAVRVAAQGAIELRPRTAAAASAGAGEAPVTRGELLDLSVGGVALSTDTRLPVGAALHASFDWEGGEYRDLPVWVIECLPRLRGLYLARLEFRGLPATEEARLATAIARRSVHSHEVSRPL